MNTTDALARLNQQLPLTARQARLSEACRRLHQAILWSLIRQGRALSRDEMAAQLGDVALDTCLKRLAKDDLVVMTGDGREVLGAYPVTTEKTAHVIEMPRQRIYAMCALDAVSVAPVFDSVVKITSNCHVTGTPVVIEMRGREILTAPPSLDVRVGVRWQKPVGHAAHSMCMEMVFLIDEHTARQWQGGDEMNISLFDLPAAVDFGSAFFKPLLNP